MNNEMLNLLLHSLDNELSAAEQQQLKEALASSEDLRSEQEKLLRTRNLLQHIAPESDAEFASRVLNRLQTATFGTKVIQLFPRVAAACAVIFALTFGTLYANTDWITDKVVGLENLSPEDADSYLNDELAINY